MKQEVMTKQCRQRLAKLAEELAEMGELVAAALTQAAADSLSEDV